MLNRILPIVAIALGAAGLLAVLVVLIARRRPAAAGRTVPRWKRKLLLAGLAMLGACGVLMVGRFSATARRHGGGWSGLKQAIIQWLSPPSPPPPPAPPAQPTCYYKIPLLPISHRGADSPARQALLDRFAADGTLDGKVARRAREVREDRRDS